MPDLIQGITGTQVSDKYDTIITVLVFVLMYYGVDYLYRRFVSDKKPKNVTEGSSKVVSIASDLLNISQEHVREVVEESVKGIKKLSIAKAARNLILPAKREQNAIIRSGILEVTRPQINELPSDIDLESEEDYEITQSFQDVEIEIRATDIDRTKHGWAGVLRGVYNKRLRMEVFPAVNREKIFGKDLIRGDIILVSRKQPDETYKPLMFHLVGIHG